ncbi:hypothetical protein O5D80_000332 [Batrachochytrium dendrobatidis]|nr:hypothetical protein O5D80_000332 [Batrachochytrium dendrobatidis]
MSHVSTKESQEIEVQLKKDKELYLKTKKEPHLLLLGSGDSGKTTFLRQIKILHGGGFSKEEKRDYLERIATNIFDSIAELLRGASENNGTFSAVTMESIDKIHSQLSYSRSTGNLSIVFRPFTLELANHINIIWNDEYTQKLFANRAKFKLQIQDTADYFLSRIMTIAGENYTPTEEDIIRIRSQTTRITETIVTVGKNTYHFYDVGGQIKYRKQWTPYFDTVHSIVFVVSLASFDQFLAEDPTINRMHDALDLFGQISDHPLLRHIPITLFLNKKDLFAQKFPTANIQQYFPDYQAKDIRKAMRYFENKFHNQNKVPGKEITCHFTCCTDTSAMGLIIMTVLEAMVKLQLKTSGLTD